MKKMIFVYIFPCNLESLEDVLPKKEKGVLIFVLCVCGLLWSMT